MRSLIAFNNITADGYFSGANGDLSWAKANQDPEFQAYTEQNAKGGGTLLFGRITYEMMVSYWPTPMAAQHNPVVAERMNNLKKYVFSKTLDKASWHNTRLLKGDLVEEVRKLKEQQDGDGMVILGSGSIVAQLAQASLIDEFQMVVNPIALGKGRTMFDNIQGPIRLKLTNSRTFTAGNVLLTYEPVRQ
jgi:dihydrofolate reductase